MRWVGAGFVGNVCIRGFTVFAGLCTVICVRAMCGRLELMGGDHQLSVIIDIHYFNLRC